MSEEDLEPLDARIVDLLRSHAPPLVAPRGAEARLLERLAIPIPDVKPPIGGAASLAKLLGAGAIGIVLGGVGVTLLTRPPPPTERIVYVNVPAAASEVVALPAASATTTSVSVDALPSVRPLPRPPAETDAVAAERALLDEARSDLMRGDSAACLSALDRHAARYPHGTLAEEREALAVRALVAAGRTSEARDRAKRFVAAYPTSLMRPAVEAAVKAPDPK